MSDPLPLVPGLRRAPNPYLMRQYRSKPDFQKTTEDVVIPEEEQVGNQEATERVLNQSTSHDSPKIMPPWLVHNNEVLRYFAYFKERVFEGDKVNFLIRRLVVSYFVASGMIQIKEPKEPNSGIVQGTFMKPQKVLKPNPDQKVGTESYFSPADFSIGGSVNVFGRDLIIVDADSFTRDWHQRHLEEVLGPAISYPADEYKSKRLEAERPMRLQQDTKATKAVPFPFRDSRVLKFSVAYEDPRAKSHQRQGVLAYHLVDDTMEIKERKEEGYFNFPNLFKRQKVPKAPGSSEYYSFLDLQCGKSIEVYGHHILLLSCDESTLDYYKAKGIQQTPLHIAARDHTKPKLKIQVANPNGFGTDDDLYALGLKLGPNRFADKHDRVHKSNRKNRVLHFVVHIMRGGAVNGSREEDTTRDLVLNYFEFDETISIYETPIKNSGSEGGLVLARGKYKKFIEKKGIEKKEVPGGSLSRFLRPSDFLLGAAPVTLEVPQSGFRLFTVKTVGYDEYTRKALEDLYQDAPAVHLILEKQAENFVSASLPVRASFRKLDETRKGLITLHDFISLVKYLETQADAVPATDDEMLALIHEFSNQDGEAIYYDDYIDALCMYCPKTVFIQAKEAVGAYTLTIEEKLCQALAEDFIHRTNSSSFIRQSFRLRDPEKTGRVAAKDWFSILKQHHLTSLMTENEANTLFLQYEFSDSDQLSYQDLCDSVFVGNFDDAIDAEKQYIKHEAPTVNKYLSHLKQRIECCDGDMHKQLQKSLLSFNSNFSRLPRKRILRKIWTAFDSSSSNNQGLINQEQFYVGIKETTREFGIDFNEFDCKTLGNYLFPGPASRVNYEKLLNAICSRDLDAIALLREESILNGALLNDQTKFREEAKSRTRDFGGTLKIGDTC